MTVTSWIQTTRFFPTKYFILLSFLLSAISFYSVPFYTSTSPALFHRPAFNLSSIFNRASLDSLSRHKRNIIRAHDNTYLHTSQQHSEIYLLLHLFLLYYNWFNLLDRIRVFSQVYSNNIFPAHCKFHFQH